MEEKGKNKEAKLQLEDLYVDKKARMEEQGFQCQVFGSAGILCAPCPHHPNDAYDAIYLDFYTTMQNMWKCIKDTEIRPLRNEKPPAEDKAEVPEIPAFGDDLIALMEIRNETKVKAEDRAGFLTEWVARKYLTSNLLISIRRGDQESYETYKYNPEQGIYEKIGPGAIVAQTSIIYRGYSGKNPSISTTTLIKKLIQEYSVREGDESIFSWDKGFRHYLPGRIRDIEIDTITGEMRLLEKDPINRPFIKRMSYDFSTLSDPPASMPRELEFLKKYTTPRFFVNILAMIAKAVLPRGEDIIFINYSRSHGTGKTTLFDVIDTLFGDVVARADIKDFYYQFFESTLIGKTLLLLEEYEGYSPTVNKKLKVFASDRGRIEGMVKFRNEKVKAPNTLAVVLNMNRLKLSEEFLEETAFMQRIVVTPFTHKWRKEEFPEWAHPVKSETEDKYKEVKEKLVIWIVKNLVPEFIKGKLKPVSYSRSTIRRWVEHYDGIPPVGLDKFLREKAIEESEVKNKQAVFVPLDTAYYYYQLWCDAQVEKGEDYLPLTDEEFIDFMNYDINARYLAEKDGVKGIWLKSVNLSFFT